MANNEKAKNVKTYGKIDNLAKVFRMGVNFNLTDFNYGGQVDFNLTGRDDHDNPTLEYHVARG